MRGFGKVTNQWKYAAISLAAIVALVITTPPAMAAPSTSTKTEIRIVCVGMESLDIGTAEFEVLGSSGQVIDSFSLTCTSAEQDIVDFLVTAKAQGYRITLIVFDGTSNTSITDSKQCTGSSCKFGLDYQTSAGDTDGVRGYMKKVPLV